MTDTPRDTRIETALTPEEWRADLEPGWSRPGGPPYLPLNLDDAEEHYDTPHKLAARCLYGQPFGFTREDVEYIRGCMEMLKRHGDGRDAAFYNPQLASLADRIAALLPPEDK